MTKQQKQDNDLWKKAKKEFKKYSYKNYIPSNSYSRLILKQIQEDRGIDEKGWEPTPEFDHLLFIVRGLLEREK